MSVYTVGGRHEGSDPSCLSGVDRRAGREPPRRHRQRAADLDAGATQRSSSTQTPAMSDLKLSLRDNTGLDVLIAVEPAVPLGLAAGLAQDFRNPPAFVPLELV